MRKTSIPNKLNHKLQANARVCEENSELEKYNEIFLKYFAAKGSTLKDCGITVTQPFRMKLTTKILYSIKVLVLQ